MPPSRSGLPHASGEVRRDHHTLSQWGAPDEQGSRSARRESRSSHRSVRHDNLDRSRDPSHRSISRVSSVNRSRPRQASLHLGEEARYRNYRNEQASRHRDLGRDHVSSSRRCSLSYSRGIRDRLSRSRRRSSSQYRAEVDQRSRGQRRSISYYRDERDGRSGNRHHSSSHFRGERDRRSRSRRRSLSHYRGYSRYGSRNGRHYSPEYRGHHGSYQRSRSTTRYRSRSNSWVPYMAAQHLQSFLGRLAGKSNYILSQISERIKRRIWSNKFVEMNSLLPPTPSLTENPNDDAFEVKLVHDNLKVVPKSRKNKIDNIETWTTAFLRFVVVYTAKSEKEKEEIPDLTRYAEIVRDLAIRHPGDAFLMYDLQFRTIRVYDPISWDYMHTALWMQCATPSILHQVRTCQKIRCIKIRRVIFVDCPDLILGKNKRFSVHVSLF